MSHYSNNPGLVRVDLFKPSGKWYATGSIDMSEHYNDAGLHEAILVACEQQRVGEGSQEGWPVMVPPREWLSDGGTIVCLQPYHEHSHPIMLTSETFQKTVAA